MQSNLSDLDTISLLNVICDDDDDSDAGNGDDKELQLQRIWINLPYEIDALVTMMFKLQPTVSTNESKLI